MGLRSQRGQGWGNSESLSSGLKLGIYITVSVEASFLPVKTVSTMQSLLCRSRGQRYCTSCSAMEGDLLRCSVNSGRDPTLVERVEFYPACQCVALWDSVILRETLLYLGNSPALQRGDSMLPEKDVGHAPGSLCTCSTMI